MEKQKKQICDNCGANGECFILNFKAGYSEVGAVERFVGGIAPEELVNVTTIKTAICKDCLIKKVEERNKNGKKIGRFLFFAGLLIFVLWWGYDLFLRSAPKQPGAIDWVKTYSVVFLIFVGLWLLSKVWRSYRGTFDKNGDPRIAGIEFMLILSRFAVPKAKSIGRNYIFHENGRSPVKI